MPTKELDEPLKESLNKIIQDFLDSKRELKNTNIKSLATKKPYKIVYYDDNNKKKENKEKDLEDNTAILMKIIKAVKEKINFHNLRSYENPKLILIFLTLWTTLEYFFKTPNNHKKSNVETIKKATLLLTDKDIQKQTIFEILDKTRQFRNNLVHEIRIKEYEIEDVLNIMIGGNTGDKADSIKSVLIRHIVILHFIIHLLLLRLFVIKDEEKEKITQFRLITSQEIDSAYSFASKYFLKLNLDDSYFSDEINKILDYRYGSYDIDPKDYDQMIKIGISSYGGMYYKTDILVILDHYFYENVSDEEDSDTLKKRLPTNKEYKIIIKEIENKINEIKKIRKRKIKLFYINKAHPEINVLFGFLFFNLVYSRYRNVELTGGFRVRIKNQNSDEVDRFKHIIIHLTKIFEDTKKKINMLKNKPLSIENSKSNEKKVIIFINKEFKRESLDNKMRDYLIENNYAFDLFEIGREINKEEDIAEFYKELISKIKPYLNNKKIRIMFLHFPYCVLILIGMFFAFIMKEKNFNIEEINVLPSELKHYNFINELEENKGFLLNKQFS